VHIDGHDVASADADHPLRLSPNQPAVIDVRLANPQSRNAPVLVRSLRFDGRVLGLAFFSYATRIDLVAPPGGSDERSFSIDLTGLDGQATGLIPARVQLIDPHGTAIATQGFVVDVRGSLWSVYGVFGLAVAAITILLLGGALWALFRGRQQENRWRRGLTFAGPGLGVGFVLTFTLSATRLLVPSPGTWALLIGLGGCIGFAAGYLAPSPASLEPSDPDSVSDNVTDGGAPAFTDVLADADTQTDTEAFAARESDSELVPGMSDGSDALSTDNR
jgi:hypothetical protein